MKQLSILVLAGILPVAAAAQDVAAAQPGGAPAAEAAPEIAGPRADTAADTLADSVIETAAEPGPAAATAAEAELRGTPALPFPGSEVALSDFLWIARPIVVFADTPADPAFQRQMQLLRARPGALAERDVVVITDTDPAGRSEVRLALRPRGFMLAILGKDGQVELRKPAPWDVREISRTIDKIPLRQQEIRAPTPSAD